MVKSSGLLFVSSLGLEFTFLCTKWSLSSVVGTWKNTVPVLKWQLSESCFNGETFLVTQVWISSVRREGDVTSVSAVLGRSLATAGTVSFCFSVQWEVSSHTSWPLVFLPGNKQKLFFFLTSLQLIKLHTLLSSKWEKKYCKKKKDWIATNILTNPCKTSWCGQGTNQNLK